MGDRSVIAETSFVTSLKLGMWIGFINFPTTCHQEYTFVQSIDNGFAQLSNGLVMSANGEIVDPANNYTKHEDYFFSTCFEVTLAEYTKQELEEKARLSRHCDYPDDDGPGEGWSPTDEFCGSDSERGLD